jgi:hypothetical protein
MAEPTKSVVHSIDHAIMDERYIHIYNTLYNKIKKGEMISRSDLSYKQSFTLQERIEKSKQQMAANPGKILVIVEKNKKSSLPKLPNPRYCNIN